MVQMLAAIKKLWAKHRKNVIEIIGDVNNSFGSTLGAKKKFLKWAEDNQYQVEVFEFSSFLEAGFSYWQVRKGHSCAKAVLVDERQHRTGVCLLTAYGHGMRVKFVPAEEIKFKSPLINCQREQ